MKEINRYRLALIQYQLSRFLPIFGCQNGFCYHFRVYGENNRFQDKLPMLYSLRPIGKYGYWFKQGLLKPRIELLKQAIKLCKLENSTKT